MFFIILWIPDLTNTILQRKQRLIKQSKSFSNRNVRRLIHRLGYLGLEMRSRETGTLFRHPTNEISFSTKVKHKRQDPMFELYTGRYQIMPSILNDVYADTKHQEEAERAHTVKYIAESKTLSCKHQDSMKPARTVFFCFLAIFSVFIHSVTASCQKGW